jgi:hypothetical protein
MIGTDVFMAKEVQGLRIDWGFGNLDFGYQEEL